MAAALAKAYRPSALFDRCPGAEHRRRALEDEIRSLGCRIFYCPKRNLWLLRRRLAQTLTDHGPYDIVCSHVHYLGGLVVRFAAKKGVPIRSVHSRNDTRNVKRDAGLIRRAHTRLMRRWIEQYAKCRGAISAPAAEDLFGAAWLDDCAIVYSTRAPCVLAHRWRALKASIRRCAHLQTRRDQRFRRRARSRMKRFSGPSPTDFGRHIDDNQMVLSVMKLADMTDCQGVLRYAHSHHEGLGLAVVEAQAADLRCVIADHLPCEIEVVPQLVTRLQLLAGPATWDPAVLEGTNLRRTEAAKALSAIMATDLNSEESAGNIMQLYQLERSRLRCDGTQDRVLVARRCAT